MPEINWTAVKLQNERARLAGCIANGIKETDPVLDGLKRVIANLEAELAEQGASHA